MEFRTGQPRTDRAADIMDFRAAARFLGRLELAGTALQHGTFRASVTYLVVDIAMGMTVPGSGLYILKLEEATRNTGGKQVPPLG